MYWAPASEGFGLLADYIRHRHDSGTAVGVGLVEGPLDHRVGAGEHALYRPAGERLGVLPEVDGQGRVEAQLAVDHGLVIIAVAVGADEAAELHTGEVLGEVGDHVAALHLAVDQDVDADVFLELDDLARRLADELVELLIA